MFQRRIACSGVYVRSEKRMKECRDGRVLVAYARDDINSSGKRLLAIASNNKLAPTYTVSGERKREIYRTLNGISSRDDQIPD